LLERIKFESFRVGSPAFGGIEAERIDTSGDGTYLRAAML
jgi:hypothetical protein